MNLINRTFGTEKIIVVKNGEADMFEFEKAVSKKSLWEAWQTIKVKSRNKTSGIDCMDVGAYTHDEYSNIEILHYSLISGAYRPYKERSFISKKNRNIYISCLEDKIIQTSIANVISELVTFYPSVHSFIKGRSIFTAYFKLKKYLPNADEFYKIDIQKFYESISKALLMEKLEQISGDRRFLDLINTILMNHPRGISTGSSLSPVLSNIYLYDFDFTMSKNSAFYLRYVDDMLIAPHNSMQELISSTKEELEERKLTVNPIKSKVVSVREGFKYLGFDIMQHRDMDNLISSGNFAEAEITLNAYKQDLENPADFDKNSTSETADSNKAEKFTVPLTTQKDDKFENTNDAEVVTEPDVPRHILAIEKHCHIVQYLIKKAKEEQFLSYPEKRVLLYIYKCLKDDGQKYIHSILSNCMDYEYNITQGYIERCRIQQPIGCKKICDVFDDCCDKFLCKCNFKNENLYPTPLIHALRQKKDCFTLPKNNAKKTSNNIGHFKKLPVKQDINETLVKTLKLHRQINEMKIQQNICKKRLESLFENNGYQEIETPHGLLIKNNEGLFIKL